MSSGPPSRDKSLQIQSVDHSKFLEDFRTQLNADSERLADHTFTITCIDIKQDILKFIEDRSC